MSRKVREIKKNFKVFCEGVSEYNYIDEMRRQYKLSIAIKPVNMLGGGYSNFLEILKTDGTTNCLAKFIMVDGDRVIKHPGEKKNLQKLIEYCILQNNSKRIPHILIVNFPDFEYIACLHTPKYKGQNTEQYIMKELGYKSLAAFKADPQIYHVLNTKGSSSRIMLETLADKKTFITNQCKVNKKLYEITVKTSYDWNIYEHSGSNIKEYFEILECF